MTMRTEPTWAVVGPTASGKSSLATRIAKALDGEIVSCDSVQVYRGFDIGSAKPTPQEQREIPHHCIDLVEWHEPFDAQEYVEHARAAVQDIRARGRAPVVCGGTGLYLRALRFGLMAAPQVDPALRAALTMQTAQDPAAAHARLAALDPDSAAKIPPSNQVQVVRALELCLSSGRPASALRKEHGFKQEQCPMRVVVLGWDPGVLRARIFERVEQMLAAGWTQEVEELLAHGVSPACRPMQAVGYREVCRAVTTGAVDGTALKLEIGRSTALYAKRQRTWFRKEPGVHWLSVTSLEDGFAQWEKLRSQQGS